MALIEAHANRRLFQESRLAELRVAALPQPTLPRKSLTTAHPADKPYRTA